MDTRTRQKTRLQAGALPVGGTRPAAEGLPHGGPSQERGHFPRPGPSVSGPGPPSSRGLLAPLQPFASSTFSLGSCVWMGREGWTHRPSPFSSVLNWPPLSVTGPLSTVQTQPGLQPPSVKRESALQGPPFR